MKTFGIDVKKLFNAFLGMLSFIKNYFKMKKQISLSDKEFVITNFYPCPDDRFQNAGSVSKHYFLQDLYVAQKIFRHNPQKHVDIGSRIEGFISNVASFREVEIFDIREFNFDILNVVFRKADIMDVNFPLSNYTDSISSLHAVEHFGLGRYGDPLDYNGHIKGLNNIYKLLKPNGKFYFSVPIGKQRIEFDAHRVFSISYLLKYFDKKYKLDSLAYIDDDDKLFSNVGLNSENIQNNFGCNYGCGIFELTKI
jgi:SAM-dependent methyltransferase